MKYLFIDVETPNRHNDSVCSVAWILRDGQREIGREYQLIDPEAPFDPMNMSIHGIRPDDVAGAPAFIEYWTDTLGPLCEGSVLIAHNASFDLSVIAEISPVEGFDLTGYFILIGHVDVEPELWHVGSIFGRREASVIYIEVLFDNREKTCRKQRQILV